MYLCKHTHTHTEPHKQVLSHFQSHPNLTSLDLSDHTLCPAHLGPLFQVLQGQSSLTALSLSGCCLKDDGVKTLTSALASHLTLHSLDLSCTAITSQVACLLVHVPTIGCCLQSVCLCLCQCLWDVYVPIECWLQMSFVSYIFQVDVITHYRMDQYPLMSFINLCHVS